MYHTNACSEGVERNVEPIKISRAEARQLAVIGQRLDRRPRGKVTKARVLETIEHLGCVQLDTISVVARSHETVLWSRLGAFDPALVWKLYEDRKLFEYWTHAAAITPIHMFPYFRATMDRFRDGDVGSWLEQHAELAAHIMAEIEANGPQQSRSFEGPLEGKASPWEWYGGKPAKQALDYLWCIGDLTVVNRQGFQRLYDLTARSIDDDVRVQVFTAEERQRFFTAKALSAMGIATARWTADYFRTGGKPHVYPKDSAAQLDSLVQEGSALRVEIEGVAEHAWLHPGMLAKLDDLRAGRGKPVLTTLLSPFDSLVWHRGRALDLFDFDYRIEVYTPEPKRKYGYYSLPILHRGRLIGRIDLHYNRKAKLLTIRAAHLEPNVKPSEPIATAIIGAVTDYLRFLGGGEIVLGSVTNPPALAPMLKQAIHSGESEPESVFNVEAEAAVLA
jgi:uncharacterized protein YcaQ